MNIRPLRDQILLTPVERAKTSAGGIHLIDDTVERDNAARYCRVLATGPGVMTPMGRREPQVKTGDIVAVSRFCAGAELVNDGIPVMLVREDEILAVEEAS